jgi:hypothetical protein
MNQKQEEKKPINKWRVIFSILYLVIFVGLLVIFGSRMFYFNVAKDSWNLYRFVWCLAFTSLGFSLIAFYHRRVSLPPYPEYILHYPVQLGAMAAVVFSILHLFEATSGYVFYYLSSSLCFTLGFLVDQYWDMFKSIIGKISK